MMLSNDYNHKKLLKRIGKIGFIFLMGGLLFWLIHKRQEIYHYDVNNDYVYNFSKNSDDNITLTLEDNSIILPDNNKNWDTALLSVNIKATLPFGYFIQPSIELSSDDDHIKQSFEYGASGIRYLNLSRFITLKKKKIYLKTHYLTLTDVNVHLSLYQNQEITQSRILVLAPHPDDAEIAAYGLYSKGESYIVTVTAGENGRNKYDELYPNKSIGLLLKGELRVWDSLFIPSLAGITPEHTVNLGYFDKMLDKMYADKLVPVVSEHTGIQDINFFRRKNVSKLLMLPKFPLATWDSLVNDLSNLLLIIKPTIIVSPFPALDNNMDHKYTTLALLEAIKKLNLTDGSLYLYSNHCPLNHFYPYGEKGETVSLPPNFGTSPIFSKLYSHPLTEAEMIDKLLALEAMHDLRLDTEWLTLKGAFKVFLKSLGNHLFNNDKSYFRRAVQANELFFVLPIRDIYDDTVVQQLKG